MTCRLETIVYSQTVYIVKCNDCKKDLAAIPRRSPYATMLLGLIPKLHSSNCWAKRQDKG